jgi:predicted RNA binding protein YcfA (HicA-like mRNA interferase family)
MPKLGPVSLRVFTVRMRKFGWNGPYQEGKHPYMMKGSLTLTLPNPHEGEISPDLLVRILRQAGITRTEWMVQK